MCTRRSARRAATAAAAGIPMMTSRMSATLSDISLVKNGTPVNGAAATAGRSRKNTANPAAMPAVAATADSMAEITETCRGAAPASRIAAKRSSRRAADTRVAVPMKMSTGNSSPRATAEKMRSIPLASRPAPTRQLLPSHPLGGVVSTRVTVTAPGTWASWPAVRPMMMTREFGAGSAAGPIVPIWCPGYRSPS
jgi:hypothetical protein